MIPYFEQPVFVLGPLRLHLFGLLVALGTVLGFRVAVARGVAAGLPRSALRRAAWVAVLTGFPISYLVLVLFERPDVLLGARWRELLAPPFGMSQVGGLLGALLGLAVDHALRRESWWRLADALVQGVAVGFVFGRLGCFFAHDHIGLPSTFPLAVAFPDGPRHDLGLYGFLLFTLLLVPASTWLHHRGPSPPGLQVALLTTLYAPTRFLLDFLRVTEGPNADARFGGLTYSQWGCVGLMAFAVWVWPRAVRGELGAGLGKGL